MRLKLGLVELAPDTTGGAATYGRAMRHILSKVCEELDFDLIRLVHDKNRDHIAGIDDSVISYRKWTPKSRQNPLERLWTRIQGPADSTGPDSLPKVLVREKVDLVWFLAPNRVIEQVRDTPFVMTVWDLAHREVQGFPEFNSGRGWAQRESWYTQNIGRAFHVVTDSSHTGKSLERIYGLYPHNWTAVGLPFPPEIAIDDAKANEIESPYFYYPASFWPHKNHKVLIDALALLEDTLACLVFTGTDEGMEAKLKQYAREKGLEDRVMFLGRVTDAEVQGLITGASAIVMPSMLGPTNYPPLEALKLGVPALVSTAHHFDEIPEGYFLTLDPHDKSVWAEEMAKALTLRKSRTSTNKVQDGSASRVKSILWSFLRTQRIARLT
jgi:glycosyltransferase involved in cell wall biosynthesis